MRITVVRVVGAFEAMKEIVKAPILLYDDDHVFDVLAYQSRRRSRRRQTAGRRRNRIL